jgi:TRAP-type C4-dicarboxylate transport system substrate-binding protein
LRWSHLASLALFVVLASTAPLHAGATLRMATIAPEGTAWARELHAFARDIEAATHGDVRIKWYFGAVAGDETEALARVRRGQLDGLAGPSFCEQLAPSLRAFRVVGLFQSRDEVVDVLSRMAPQLDEEFRKSGFVNLLDAVFGSDILFSRRPVRNMAEFRATRWWMWNLSTLFNATLPKLGARLRPMPIEQLAAAYREGLVDGFIMPPGVALAFQVSPLAGYYADLDTAMLPGCMVLSNAAMDPLPIDHQRAIRTAGAKFRLRFNHVNAELDHSLINGLFEKQGLKRTDVSPQFRYEFLEAAKGVRSQLDEKLLPPKLLARILAMLADYRAIHAPESER